MTNNIKNSSGKVIGTTETTNTEIIIKNDTKPVLIINDLDIVNAVNQKNRDNSIIQKLYDEYFLSCGEIASLYEVCYSNMNKQMKNIEFKTTAKQGRRNRSYGKSQSQETKNRISETLKDGYETGRIAVTTYERTPEIREKISQSLKEYFKDHPQDPEPHRQNWRNGVYDNIDFHAGIGGNFVSIKNNKTMNFRSLLELYYMLMLEEDDNVAYYEYEPVHINCEDGRVYTPDLLVNGHILIELKSKRYIEKLGGEVLENFNYKKEQGQLFSQKNEYEYKVVFDCDIGFDSTRFKKHLKHNPDIIEKYNIIFHQPERMVIK